MSTNYIDNNLLPDEKIIFRTKKHFIVFLVPVIFLILALFFSTDNPLTRSMNTSLSATASMIPVLNSVGRLPALFFTIAMIFSGIQQYFLYLLSDYVVTNKRVIMREGLFLRQVSDLRINTISNVNIDQGVLAQILNYGNVSINGFGGSIDRFYQVNKPADFQKAVHEQIHSLTTNTL